MDGHACDEADRFSLTAGLSGTPFQARKAFPITFRTRFSGPGLDLADVDWLISIQGFICNREPGEQQLVADSTKFPGTAGHGAAMVQERFVMIGFAAGLAILAGLALVYCSGPRHLPGHR